MSKIKVAFIVSLILNFLFISITSIHYYNKKNKVVLTKPITNITELSPYFKNRQSLYNILPVYGSSIIFLGDSITDFGEWSELFYDGNIKNRAIEGDTTKGLLNRLDNIVAAKPSKIFIMIGINNLSSKEAIPEIINDYNNIINTIKKGSLATEIYVQSILPIDSIKTGRNNSDIILLNTELQKLAKENNVFYIDLHTLFLKNQELDLKYSYDGIHLNGEGYLLWKSIIEEYIN